MPDLEVHVVVVHAHTATAMGVATARGGFLSLRRIGYQRVGAEHDGGDRRRMDQG